MRRASLIALMLLTSTPVAAQHDAARMAVLSLMVTDDATDAPLSDVRVSIVGQSREWATGERGMLNVAIEGGGRVVLVLRRLGYEPASLIATLVPGDTTRVAYFLKRNVQALETARVIDTVTSRATILHGFELRRSRRDGGSFLTRDQIERRGSMRTSALLRRVLGARVVDSAGVLMVASSRGFKVVATGKGVDLAPCVMRVVLDGVIREPQFSIDLIDPKEIHGIEVYNGPATVPAEFGGMRKDAMCGLVMIWTRVDR